MIVSHGKDTPITIGFGRSLGMQWVLWVGYGL